MRSFTLKKFFTPLDLLLALLGFCLILSLSVVLILNLRSIYYHDMKALKLSRTYQMTEEEIKENYDALIDYNSLFYQGELSSPSLPMSEEGRIHFEEVKAIFDGLQWLLILSAALFLPLAWHQLFKRQNRGFLLLTPVFTGLVGIFAGILAAADWEWFFTAFHRLFFRNDYWLFDPLTDPVINLLPDLFFFHCLAGILICMAALLLVSLAGYFLAGKRKKTVNFF